MEKQSFSRRILFPIALVMGTMIVSINAYDLSRSIENQTTHQSIAHISAVFMFLSIWLGAFFANTIAFFRGASFGERAIVCLATPVVWSAKVFSDFIGIYPLGELIFFLFFPLIIGCPVVALLCMSISELWCRKTVQRRRGDRSIRVFALPNTLMLIISFSLTFIFLWQGGLYYVYNVYMVAYRYIFH
jgi:hypothetical protein